MRTLDYMQACMTERIESARQSGGKFEYEKGVDA